MLERRRSRSVAESRSFWDEQAELVDEVVANGYGMSPDEHRANVLLPYLELLQVETHHSVLDVGCGTGLLLAELEQRAARVVGTDTSDAMLARYQGKAELVVAAAHELQFPAGSFDRISMIYVAPAFPDADYFERVVRRLFALLRDGGILLVAGILVKPPPRHSPYSWISRQRLVRLGESFGCYFSLLAPVAALRDSRVHERCEFVVYRGSSAVTAVGADGRWRPGRRRRITGGA